MISRVVPLVMPQASGQQVFAKDKEQQPNQPRNGQIAALGRGNSRVGAHGLSVRLSRCCRLLPMRPQGLYTEIAVDVSKTTSAAAASAIS